MGAVPGLYKRPLPCPPAIEFASQQGKVLFEEALRDGTMNGFFRLIATFETQAEPAFCGLASLTVVLNALSIDPGRQWKGPWRWFDESMLDCCEPLEKVKRDGITFSKVVCLAECAGASVKAFHSDESSLELFRDVVRECTSSDDHHVIASYDRRTFEQTGTGHFSPLGGYHSGKDMALVLDVARFKYPPHWVPLTLLWDAINTIDSSTGKLRGFMTISKRGNPPAVLFTLSCNDENWKTIFRHLFQDVPELLRTTNLIRFEQVLDSVFGSLPADVTSFMKWKVEVKTSNGSHVERTDKTDSERIQLENELLRQLRDTKAFHLITKWIDSMPQNAEQNDENLQDTVIQACCQGAAVFAGSQTISGIQRITTEYHMRSDMIGWSKFSVDIREQNVEAFIPRSPIKLGNDSYSAPLQPTRQDLLSVLLLSLPMSTWNAIANSDVYAKIVETVTREHLPIDLQLEVAHLARQAYVLSKCLDEEQVPLT